MTNEDLVTLLLKYPPDMEVKLVEEKVVQWNEDNTPKIISYFEAYPYEVQGSLNNVIIRVKRK